jgi:hypothetical protein
MEPLNYSKLNRIKTDSANYDLHALLIVLFVASFLWFVGLKKIGLKFKKQAKIRA